jgi:c-di-GMP-binding flagellar brake protein YcgR
MDATEKRKYPRVRIHNLISYVCLGEDGRPIKHLMGTALDISQGGLLLETTQQIEPGNGILITADEQDRIVEIKGKAVYCRETKSGKYCVGISFQGTPGENNQFVQHMVRANYYRRGSVQSKQPELTEEHKLC